MYQKPDFVKVTIDSANAFANSSNCPGDYSGVWMWTGEGCHEYYQDNVLVAGTSAWQCYSDLNP